MKIPKLFFWQKRKEKTMAEKLEEALPALIKYLPDIRKLMRQQSDPSVSTDGQIIGHLYDFAKDAEMTVNASTENWLIDDNGEVKDTRLLKKPKEVEDELERSPLPPNLENLDEKIALLKDKSALTNQRYVQAQIDGMITRLENRKKYKEFAHFFESFPSTNDEKIDDLLKKYKLVLKESTLFIPTFPKEAIAVMKEYSEATKKLSGEKPVSYVIAEAADFEKKQKRLDPILLV